MSDLRDCPIETEDGFAQCGKCGLNWNASLRKGSPPCGKALVEDTVASERTIADVQAEQEAADTARKVGGEFRHARSWLVQMRDGRALRVDADRCSPSNGVLTFTTRDDALVAAFEYGDWKRVCLMDRATGENIGWTTVKEKPRR